jgi:hypothetical protein
MAETKTTIAESWPALKNDLLSFLADTDEWIMTELKNACKAKDWKKVRKVIDIMESVHSMSHSE